MRNYSDFDPAIPDFVAEAEAAMAAGETFAPEEKQEVTIKFGKGLVGEPFISKNDKELVEVKIPNADPADYRPWKSFVISPKMIHENKFGKGLWMKLPEDGSTRLSRSVNPVYSAVYEEKALAGAKYQVIAAEDIYTGDGTLRTEAGTVVAEITTGEEVSVRIFHLAATM